MNDDRLQRLKDAGIDVNDALNRFMGNESLLERFLNKFVADQNFKKLGEAIAAKDNEAALAASHTLKGVCGNLSMTVLSELLTKQVKAYRDGDPAAAESLMSEITAAYDKTVAAIND